MRLRRRLALMTLLWALEGSAAADDQALLSAARAALEGGRAADAERLYRQVLAADSDLLAAYRGLADALAGQRRTREAVDVLVQLGEGLLRATAHEPAIAALRRAVELAPETAAAHGLLGRALSREDRYLEAARSLERAVELGAGELRILLYLGAAHWENGDVDRAEEVYRRAVAAGGSSFLPRHQLGRLLAWRGRSAEAVEILEEAARTTTAVDVELDLARALLAAGDVERAVAAFRRVVVLSPGRSHGRYGLAQALARAGKPEAARAELEVYHRLYREEQDRVREQEVAKARLGHGWELLRDGRTHDAVAYFEGLPASADVLVGLAAARAAAGNASAAVTALELAVDMAPDRGDLRLRLAEARLEARP